MVGLATLLGQLVVAGHRRILERLARSMLVSVTGMLDQLALSLLKTLSLSLPGLDQRPLSLGGRPVCRRGIGARPPADGSGLSGSPLGLLFSSVWPWHQPGTTRGRTRETVRGSFHRTIRRTRAVHRTRQISSLLPGAEQLRG